MATRVWVASVHVVGEDNEGNTAFVARTREALEAKVLAFHNSCYEDLPTSTPEELAENAEMRYATFADMVDDKTYAVSVDEDLLED